MLDYIRSTDEGEIKVRRLVLRRFQAEDMDDLYAIRNHSSVRKYMMDTTELDYQKHYTWASQHLLSAERDVLLFIARIDNEACGFSLIRDAIGSQAEIGFIFRRANDLHQLLYIPESVVAFGYFLFAHLDMRELYSYVVNGHERALRLNLAFGGEVVPSDRDRMTRIRITRKNCMESDAYTKIFGRIADVIKVDDTLAPMNAGRR